MSPNPIDTSRNPDVPRQLTLPLRYRAEDPPTEQDHPEEYEREIVAAEAE